MKKQFIIWGNHNLDLDDWRKDLLENARANGEDADALTEDDLYQRMMETNSDYLNDERANLNIDLGEPILVIADLGLWNGRHRGYREIASGNISDCLYSRYDYTTWYVDGYGNLRCDDTHHDGTNHYLYRVWKSDISEQCKETVRGAILDGSVTPTLLGRYTRAIGPYIAKAYGWKVRGAKQPKAS